MFGGGQYCSYLTNSRSYTIVYEILGFLFAMNLTYVGICCYIRYRFISSVFQFLFFLN